MVLLIQTTVTENGRCFIYSNLKLCSHFYLNGLFYKKVFPLSLEGDQLIMQSIGDQRPTVNLPVIFLFSTGV